MRSAIKATIVTPRGKINVMGTHLDHIHEESRLRQLSILESYLTDVDYFMGDFNSLHLEDYTKERIEDINTQRKLSNWPLAQGDVVNKIKKCGFKVHSNCSSTSRFDTRIDFIFYRNSSLNLYFVFDCIFRHLSDHNIVVATIIK